MVARIKFSKLGSAKFIGHLDLLRYFQKAFRRANLDLTYSQGFNPRPLTTFAAPLGVGLTSESEYLDVTLNSSDEPEVMIQKINEAMANNIIIRGFSFLPEESKNAMASVAAADYFLSLKEGYDFLSVNEFQAKFREFYNQDNIIIVKKTKKSQREIDLKPLIYDYRFPESEDDSQLGIYLQLATGSVNNIKAELVMETFYKFIESPYNEFAFQTHRLEIYANIGEDGNRNLVPLDKMYN